MERAVIVLLVGLLSTFFVDAQQPDNEEIMLEGPGGLKAFVGRRGGGIRLFREMPRGPGGKGPRTTGQIEIRLGRIQETKGNDTEETDSEEMDNRPSRPDRSTTTYRPGKNPTPPKPRPRGRPPRPRLDVSDYIDFDVQNRKYAHGI